jgi:alpha-tubulin suppressor-like RCC1 family protein
VRSVRCGRSDGGRCWWRGSGPSGAGHRGTPVYRLGPDALDSSGVPDPIPIKITGLAGASIAQIVGNDDHELVLTTSGKLFAWGINFFGELRDGTKIDRPDPVQIAVPAGVGKIVQISSAYIQNVALTSTGKVLAWPGPIGGVDVLTPTVVSLPHGEVASSVSAGFDFVEYVTRAGEV